MLFKTIKYISCIALSLLILSCGEYSDVLKSDEVKVKYDYAEKMYEAGDYKKANYLFEKIAPKFIGKPQGERVLFFLADTYYKIKNYNLAGYQFERFIKSYPNSEKLEEASYFMAKSYYELSPKYSLDQTDTETALEKLQAFINTFPDSPLANEANLLAQELDLKKERKAFEIAKQYNKLGNFQLTILTSAIKSADNFLIDYPGSIYREDVLYLRLEATSKMAFNSTIDKKKERLEDAKNAYSSLLKYYPTTHYKKESDKLLAQIETNLSTFATVNK
jgi:outer membrane protein assembly factor BamD